MVGFFKFVVFVVIPVECGGGSACFVGGDSVGALCGCGWVCFVEVLEFTVDGVFLWSGLWRFLLCLWFGFWAFLWSGFLVGARSFRL